MAEPNRKRALITGVSGQDGAYLARLLVDKGYEVFGTIRRTSTPNLWRLQALGVLSKIQLIPADMADMSALMEAVAVSEPDEVYNLAAQSFVAASFESPLSTGMIDGLAPMQLLEVIRKRPGIRFYHASTSELYGNGSVRGATLTTESRLWPNSPYAAAKLLSFHATRVYREAYGIFAVNGILFNHESPMRGLEFVTRKVTNAAAKIALGKQQEVHLGNLDAERDWGYAPEYVEAMWRMLQQDKPKDVVIATGESHSVAELCEVAFGELDLDWRKYVKYDRRIVRPLEVDVLLGDTVQARESLGWSAKTRFADLIKLMVAEDLARWKRHLAGETFPWDAPNFPESDLRYHTRSLRS